MLVDVLILRECLNIDCEFLYLFALIILVRPHVKQFKSMFFVKHLLTIISISIFHLMTLSLCTENL